MAAEPTKRDPRVSPKAGDVVLWGSRVRTVYATYGRGSKIGWATESPDIASGIITLATWRKKAKEAEVLHAAD